MAHMPTAVVLVVEEGAGPVVVDGTRLLVAAGGPVVILVDGSAGSMGLGSPGVRAAPGSPAARSDPGPAATDPAAWTFTPWPWPWCVRSTGSAPAASAVRQPAARTRRA